MARSRFHLYASPRRNKTIRDKRRRRRYRCWIPAAFPTIPMGIIPRRPPPRWLPLLSPLNRASRSPCVTGGLHRLRLRDLLSSSSLPPLRRIGSPYLRRLVTSARAQETRPEKKEKERERDGEEGKSALSSGPKIPSCIHQRRSLALG